MHPCFSLKIAKDDSKLNKFLLATEKELSDFFGINIERPSIFFLDSRKDINKIWGKKTESWLSAWAKNGNIYILNPKIYTKESDHSIEHFWQAIKHEYCHLYFRQLTGVNYPKWLNEGLACYLAGQVKKTPPRNEAMKVFDYFQKSDKQIYCIAYFWVKLLIEKFGIKKLLDLFKQLKPKFNEREFKSVFYKVYKISFSEKHLARLQSIKPSSKALNS